MAQKKRVINESQQALAKLTSVRVSPRKLGIVAQAIRGLSADKALVQLEFMRRRVAKEVKACLMSAIANAENNHNLNVDDLYVSKVLVGKGLVMKRMRARARGRSGKIIKPFSNITIVVEERGE